MVDTATITGRLGRDTVAPGSKSERSSLVIETDEGTVLLVRRRGAPSFGEEDDAMAKLVGHRVALVGSVVEGTVLVDECKALSDSAEKDEPDSPAG
jgi:hypothetical protein